MQNVKIQKEKLIEIIKKNRSEHRDIFLAAQEKYRNVVIQTLDEQLQAAREKRPFELARIVGLVQPQDHTEDYDCAILMLELTEETIIELNHGDFVQFVQDQWGWTRSWTTSNSLYTKAAKLGNL